MNFLKNRIHECRPWGSFDRFIHNESSTVKILTVAPNKRLSLQRHAHRSEFWYIVSGSGTATIGTKELPAKPKDSFEIPAHTIHRLASGDEGLSVLEISFGKFDEDDIERIEDDFGRIET